MLTSRGILQNPLPLNNNRYDRAAALKNGGPFFGERMYRLEAVLYYEKMQEADTSHGLLKRAVENDCVYRQMTCPKVLTVAYLDTPEGGTKKPYLKELPWLHFSISHSDGLWMCVFAASEIGLDVQKKRDVKALSLAQRFFHPEEAAWVKEHGADDFFRIWALKEAYVKYTGKGFTGGMAYFSVIPRLLDFPQIPDADSSFLCGIRLEDEAAARRPSGAEQTLPAKRTKKQADLYIYEEELADGSPLAIIAGEAFFVSWRGL